LIPNPIVKVLSTLTTHQVQYLLMGGQACVLYGAAQFSRDTDVAISPAVPPFELDYLRLGASQKRTPTITAKATLIVAHAGKQPQKNDDAERNAEQPKNNKRHNSLLFLGKSIH
jgi:hypothetical protein